jgi:two-component system chemotaxis response regulator CheY
MGKKILLIDDSSLVRRQVTAALEGQGYEFVEASDGPEALQVLDANEIALVITDFTMPKMSGLELIEQIRSRPTRSDVPIIVLSTQAKVDLVERGWHLGVKAWLKKPFKPGMLASAVQSLIA